jgi:outer membrane autotransporter protein
MFAYGKNHAFAQRGDVEALGKHGIGVSFDFGHNSLGDVAEYRGSYFVDVDENIKKDVPEYYAKALEEVSGPLVDTFDLSGRVAGRYASIYMSDNGYVGQINVMQGADIEGDIISNYSRKDDNGELRVTDLTFGLKADEGGHSTNLADPGFRLAYGGNITGDNLALQIKGGVIQLTGNHQLYDVAVAPSATLSGKGIYQINTAQHFRNAGIVNPSMPGTAITIDGNYIQSESGVLQLFFNNQKAISSLIVKGKADLKGTITIAPTRSWYQNGFKITSDKWLEAHTVEGAFEKVTATIISPTLSASTTQNGNNSFTVSLSRHANAYAQYGDTVNSYAVGSAFDGIASNAGTGLRDLLATLDFSAADGSIIRAALPQLSAEPYASVIGVLSNDSYASRSTVNNRLIQAFGGAPFTPISAMGFAPAAQNIPLPLPVSKADLTRYTAWGATLGSWSSQSDDGNAARTKSTLGGFTTGIDAAVYENWRLGVMAGYSHSTVATAERGSSGGSDNYTVGTYAGTEWSTSGGVLGLRTGLAYTWHNIDMGRSVAFADFSDNLSADYTAGTFQVFGELGYKLNNSPRAIFEPYANLAYVHVRTNGFDEKGQKGAALSVLPDIMGTALSTLGLRASTGFDFGGRMVTARADLGWQHAYGEVVPTSTASFVEGSAVFSSAGNAIGRDTALIETGLDVQLCKNTVLGVNYQGQFGSRISQNGVNATLSVKF